MNFLPFGQSRIIPYQKHSLKHCSLMSRSLVIQSDLFFLLLVRYSLAVFKTLLHLTFSQITFLP